MVIVRFQGGIGNQLFQYAFYKKLEHIGKDVYADLNTFGYRTEKREYQLPLLGLEVREAPYNIIRKMFPIGEDIWSKVLRNTVFKKHCIKDRDSQVFDEKFYEYDNIYLSGYWQTEKYFGDIKDNILNNINFASIDNSDNVSVLKKIRGTNSISIHIRFGDYIENPMYKDICTRDYYISAINEMKKKCTDSRLFVFSDDGEKAREFLGNLQYDLVDFNTGDSSYYDMYLMSQCKHNIIANSSYSWWGAYLNKNPYKIVIAPSLWINNCRCDDVWLSSWLKVSPQGKVIL